MISKCHTFLDVYLIFGLPLLQNILLDIQNLCVAAAYRPIREFLKRVPLEPFFFPYFLGSVVV